MSEQEKKLTKWEAGNELVKAADCLSEVANELKDWPELRATVREARRLIADEFNEAGLVEEMGFGI